MSSQLIGVLAASVDSDADGESLQTGAWVAGNATQYNWLLHGEIEAADKAREGCNARGGDVAGCKRSITQAMDSLDKARDMERADQIRQVDLANYQEGMTPGEYKDALDSYWNGIDRSELVWTGYEPAHELGYIAGEMGSGFVKRAVDWPGKVYDTITHLTDIPANLLQAGKDGVNWINSPIPAQSLERAGDELIFATPDKLGGIVFDAATGAITAGVGGKAVEWIGGRWTLRSSANTLSSKPIELSGGTPTLEGTSFSPDIVNLRSPDALYGDNPLRGAKGEVSGLLPKPGATSIPASGVGAGAAFKVDSKQLGKKLGKHVEDFGGNAASPADRKMVLDKIHDVGSNPEKVIPGTFAGQGANGARGDVFFRVKGNDVVVTKPDGTFVTILKDGVTQNPSVQSALKGGVR